MMTGTLLGSGKLNEGPWLVMFENGKSFDVFSKIQLILAQCNGRACVFSMCSERLSFATDRGGLYTVQYSSKSGIRLEDNESHRFVDFGLILTDVFTWFSGCVVTIKIEIARFSIQIVRGTPHHLQPTNLGLETSLTRSTAESVCKIGTDRQCVFLADESSELVCTKFGTRGRERLYRNREHLSSLHVGGCLLSVP